MLISRLKISLHLNKKLIFYVHFLNFTKFLSKFFSAEGRTERERNGDCESNFTVLVRHYKCAAHLQKAREIPDLITGSGADITLLSASQQSYTCGPLADTISWIS